VAETGPVPDTKTCYDCETPILWLWSPRVNKGLGGWVRFTRESDDGMTVRSHRCQPPRGGFGYTEGESPP
jgi:hypothetical protein